MCAAAACRANSLKYGSRSWPNGMPPDRKMTCFEPRSGASCSASFAKIVITVCTWKRPVASISRAWSRSGSGSCVVDGSPIDAERVLAFPFDHFLDRPVVAVLEADRLVPGQARVFPRDLLRQRAGHHPQRLTDSRMLARQVDRGPRNADEPDGVVRPEVVDQRARRVEQRLLIRGLDGVAIDDEHDDAPGNGAGRARGPRHPAGRDGDAGLWRAGRFTAGEPREQHLARLPGDSDGKICRLQVRDGASLTVEHRGSRP